MFLHLSVILFTGGGRGVSASVHAGIHPPWADSPPPSLGRHPPEQTTPPGRHIPPGQTLPPPQQTATAADGTHPTGMHSCEVTICSGILLSCHIFYRPQTKFAKVMFSHRCLSVHRGRGSASRQGVASEGRGSASRRRICIQGERGVCIQGAGGSASRREGGLHRGRVVCIQEGSASGGGVCIKGQGGLHLGGEGSASRGGLHPEGDGVCIQEEGRLHPGGGVCIQGEGVCSRGWADPPHRILWDTANERAVRIQLECILVVTCVW